MSLSAGRVDVGVTPTKVVNTAKSAWTVLVRNRSEVPVDLGEQAVTAGAGFELEAGEAISIDMDPGETLWAVAATAGPHRLDWLVQGR